MKHKQPIASTCRGCTGPLFAGDTNCQRCGLATAGSSQRGVIRMRSADFDGRPHTFATTPFDGIDGARPTKAQNATQQKPTLGATLADRMAARRR